LNGLPESDREDLDFKFEFGRLVAALSSTWCGGTRDDGVMYGVASRLSLVKAGNTWKIIVIVLRYEPP
jgi:hypothetical protein